VEVRWLEDALADVRDIHRYIGEHNPEAAAELVCRLRDAADGLAEFSDRGRPGRWPGTCELVVPGTRYVVPYRVRGGVIEILCVFHGARRWPAPKTATMADGTE
jgi:toxin ParE1/3/4